MKLSRIYSNDEAVFPAMAFRDGFNVLFAHVRNPAVLEQDSHNLGKTFLVRVIDFVLLSDIGPEHPFKRFPNHFSAFVFYLEVKTYSGLFVTIRRKVHGTSTISIFVDTDSHEDLTGLPDANWTFPKLSLDKGRAELNKLLDLTVISPYNYRKGLGYVLRTQSDYDHVFRISRFGRGKDRDWKPFVAQLLGFDHALLSEKYALDEQVEEMQQYQKIVERDAGSSRAKYDEIKGLIEIRNESLGRLRTQLNGFDFGEVEARINRSVVHELEAFIARDNERRYIIDYEIQEIARSLDSDLKFDLASIQEIFSEVKISFPEELSRSYEDLIAFNRRISLARSERLHTLRIQLLEERAEVEIRLSRNNADRQSALSILNEQETFEKFRSLQHRVIEGEREVVDLQRRLEMLDRASTIQQDIDQLKQERTAIARRIRLSVRGDIPTYSAVRRAFSSYVERILSVPALLSVSVNDHDNLDFHVRTLDRSGDHETSEGAGTSYKKLLCACFDLALLTVHSRAAFYHFVYHDGIFEGLDNRKKVNLLEVIRSVCDEHNLQHILTVIDSDLPRDERDQKLLFTEDEILRELHEDGAEGRLFRMAAF